ncbi:MAG: patatin-like phospholipase family protein [Gemmatimonadales bacterium]|nr:patatin-like phospholipase family protein [Gemmatimonadales bacterium]
MKVVLVLSGGGAKALAHAGAFRALELADLVPDRIVGTSMGAVIGAALAAGMPFDQVRARSLGLSRTDVAPFDPLALVKGLFARSLIPATALRRTIKRLVPKTLFEYLKIPLTVTATDLDTGELMLFGGTGREGGGETEETLEEEVELLDALYASCALPLYFPPLEVGGRRFADGGLRAVLPLEAARQLEPDADLFVAVNVGPGFDEVLPPGGPPARMPRIVRSHGEAIRIMMAEQTEQAVRRWKDGKQTPRLVYVRPVAEREATFAVDRIQEYVEAGYQAVRKALA